MDIVPQVLGASVPSTAGTTFSSICSRKWRWRKRRVASAVVVPVLKAAIVASQKKFSTEDIEKFAINVVG